MSSTYTRTGNIFNLEGEEIMLARDNGLWGLWFNELNSIVVCARWSSLCSFFSLNGKFGDDFSAANLSKVIGSMIQEESF